MRSSDLIKELKNAGCTFLGTVKAIIKSGNRPSQGRRSPYYTQNNTYPSAH